MVAKIPTSDGTYICVEIGPLPAGQAEQNQTNQ